MKKTISLILALVMILSMSFNIYAANFTDFNSSHWAYEYVTELVNDGTINGYADGTFRPEGTVTRAEFVKMIGHGSEKSTNDFDDVPSNHWAYEYIMSSGLEALSDNMFCPDTPITRGDVAVLLWKRAGGTKGITAPPVVHRQGKNFDAISWVYTNGIMVGNDYIDLRLGDTLTRGEASALIVRSRKVTPSTANTNFIESVDDALFEAVYNAFCLVKRLYDANATITNGELAMAAARLLCSEKAPTYKNISATKSFEHQYAQPLNMLCRYYLGEANDNIVYAEKNATVKEAIAALMFATVKSADVYIPSGNGKTYPTIKNELNKDMENYLNMAYANGVWFSTADSINMDKEITMKELACLALELNGFSGFYKTSVTTSNGVKTKFEKIRTDIKSYPSNAKDYRIIAKDVPNYVYEKPFATSVSKPSYTHEVTNVYRPIFETMLSPWVKSLSSKGYNLQVSYYPGIAVDNGKGYTLRVGIKFINVPANTKLGVLINCVNTLDAQLLVNNGDVLYADIDTGKTVDGLYLGTEHMILSQVIR